MTDELNIPPVGHYIRIKDGLEVKVTKHSDDKTVVYIRRANPDITRESDAVWPVFTKNFWKHYKEK